MKKAFLSLLALLLVAFAACKKEPEAASLTGTQWEYPQNDTLYAQNPDGTDDSTEYMVIFNTFLLDFTSDSTGKLDIKVGYTENGVEIPAQTEHSTFQYQFDGTEGTLWGNMFLQGTWQITLPDPETLRLSYQTVTKDFTKKINP